MKVTIKRIKVQIIIMFICIICTSGTVLADSNTINKINDRTISDTHKVWTIKFSKAVDLSTFTNNVEVMDLTDGTIITTNVVAGEDDHSVKINPPTSGYKTGHSYGLTLKNNIKSKTGEKLKKITLMDFSVQDLSGGSYTANTKVVVSPVISVLKQITVTSTNLSQIKRYKIEGTDKVVALGETSAFATNNNSITIDFYGDDGITPIAKSTIDVSQSRDSSTSKIANTN